MIYLKQVKLLDPDLVAGDPEELKYPYKAPAVRFTESDENLRRFHGSIPSESPYSQRKRLWIFRSERGGKIHPAGSDDE